MENRRIHRLMFYNLDPEAIISLSFNKLKTVVAALRNNKIELWNMKAVPFLQGTILLNTQHKLRSVVWCNERLFAADLQGFIREFDVDTLHEKKSYPVTSGACHCLAANRDGTSLAAGTEAGYINIFEVNVDGLEFKKLMECGKKLLSICWDKSGKHIAVGSIDRIVVLNSKKGSVLHTLIFNRQKRKVGIIVWCIAVLDDFTIVSGDSGGRLRIWDGHTGTCVQELQDHEGDILALCLSEDQNGIYTTGADSKIQHYKRLCFKNKQTAEWMRSLKYSLHTHDVNAIVAMDQGMLCSGGIDAQLIVSKFSPFVFQRYAPFLENPSVCVAAERRCILLRYPSGIEMWQLNKLPGDGCNKVQFPTKLLDLQSCEGEIIRSAAISGDSRFLAYSTNTRFRLFKVNLDPPELEPLVLSDRTVENVHHIRFSENKEHLIIADSRNRIEVFKTDNFTLQYSMELTESQHRLCDRLAILAVSHDSRYIAAAGTQGQVVIWSRGKYFSTMPQYNKPVTALAFHPYETSPLLYAVYSDYMFVEYSLEKKTYTLFTKRAALQLVAKFLSNNLPVTNIAFDRKNNNIVILQNASTICAINKLRVPFRREELPIQGSTPKKARRDSGFEEKSPKKNKGHNSKESSFLDSEEIETIEFGEDEVSPSGKRKRIDLNRELQIPKYKFRKFIPTNKNIEARDPNKNLSQAPGINVFNKYECLAYFGSLGNTEMVAVEVTSQSLTEKLPPVLKVKRFGRA